MAEKTSRAERTDATRDAILTTAERLFAEHGVYAVSNRQISEAAGQGNTAAVGYHFGTKVDLVLAIVRRHNLHIEHRRAAMVAENAGSTDIRHWVACLVRPTIDHLADLGNPTWFARFNAQVITDPALHDIMARESLSFPSMVETVDGLGRCLSNLPEEVRAERGDMARLLMVHMVAERERALADGTPTPRGSWRGAVSGLIDAITGLWLAPVTPEV